MSIFTLTEKSLFQLAYVRYGPFCTLHDVLNLSPRSSWCVVGIFFYVLNGRVLPILYGMGPSIYYGRTGSGQVSYTIMYIVYYIKKKSISAVS